MGRHIVHRLIGLEARPGLLSLINTTELIAPAGVPDRVTSPNNNAVGEPDDVHGDNQ